MRSLIVVPLLSSLAVARRRNGDGDWWGAAPSCVQSCLSSAYAEESDKAVWPSPGRFCDSEAATPLRSCLSESCTETPSAYSSMSSLSESVCSIWSSCVDDVSAVHTFTYPTPTGDGRYSSWYASYTGDGTVVVTGCPTGDGERFGGLGPWGHGHPGGHMGGFGPWGHDYDDPDRAFWGWGDGWSSHTTVTKTVSGSDGDDDSVLTVVEAISDGVLVSTPLAAEDSTVTSGSDGDDDDEDSSSTNTVGNGSDGIRLADSGKFTALMGAALGAVVVVAGLM